MTKLETSAGLLVLILAGVAVRGDLAEACTNSCGATVLGVCYGCS